MTDGLLMAGETGYVASFLVSGHEILRNRSSCSTQGNAYTSNQRPIGLGVFQVCSGAVTEPQLTAVAHWAVTAVLHTAQQLRGQGCLLSACKPALTLGLGEPLGRHRGNPCYFQCGPNLLPMGPSFMETWTPAHLASSVSVRNVVRR